MSSTARPPHTAQAAIPARCFERSTLTSFAYTAFDLTLAVLLYVGSTYIDQAPWSFHVCLSRDSMRQVCGCGAVAAVLGVPGLHMHRHAIAYVARRHVAQACG